jgi:RHS repeat-associated protein
MVGEQTDGGTRINYVTDALGSIVQAIDENHNTTYTARYKPFVDVLSSTGTAPAFTWVGSLGYLQAAGRPHSEFYVRARIYSKMEGRWTTVDPLWPQERQYEYVSSRPVLRVDISGLSSPNPMGGAGGGTGSCSVNVCDNEGPLGLSSHESICVTGPHGGCSGGLYPDGNITYGPGQVVGNSFPCKAGTQTVKDSSVSGGSYTVTCRTISTSCSDAKRACACIKAFWLKPPNYSLYLNNCFNFASEVVECMDPRPEWQKRLDRIYIIAACTS